MTCVNKNSPNIFIELGRVEYDKQYREDNKDKISEFNKKYRENNTEYYTQYRENNKEYYTQYNKENIPCQHCGCTYTRRNKSKHEKTKKHQKNTSSDDSTISDITI